MIKTFGERMKKTETIIRWVGSVLSAYLGLFVGTALIFLLLDIQHPLAGTVLLGITIWFLGPISILFIVPAFVLSFKWKNTRTKRIALAVLNAMGIVSSVLIILLVIRGKD